MLDEFFQQGDMERAQGLPVSPLMDRGSTSLAVSQMNFIEFVVAPLFLQVQPLAIGIHCVDQDSGQSRRCG